MMMAWLLLLAGLLLPQHTSAGGSVSVNIKDLGAIQGIQSLDIRGERRERAEKVYLQRLLYTLWLGYAQQSHRVSR